MRRKDTRTGLRRVATVMGVASVHTILAYTKRQVDPLRLREHPVHGRRKPWQTVAKIDAWRRRNLGTLEERLALEVTLSWESMALLADATIAAVRELASRRRDPFPVQPEPRRNPETGRMERWAYTDAIRDWLDANAVAFELRGGPTTREDVCPPSPKRAREAA